MLTEEFQNAPRNRSRDGFILQVYNPGISQRLGRVQHALFDFDGTLSLLREGWEGLMAPMMVRCICGATPATPEIKQAVSAYIDRSTGQLTLRQMEWLEETVKDYGLTTELKTAAEYKAIYVQMIRGKVAERQCLLQTGRASIEDLLVTGALEFLSGLIARGVHLYLASGTDHVDVVNEAQCLRLEGFFGPHIYGALDTCETNDKGRVIRRLIAENRLHGEELLVVGDGPVEIQEGAACSAITLGVATDEVQRRGWNEKKVRRLVAAGANLLIPDFSQTSQLLAFLFSKEPPKPGGV